MTHNLSAGQPDGDRGRKLGASAGGKAVAAKPAPADCEHCRRMGYTSWHQHIGHKGFRAVMDDHPTALHSLRDKVARTGRADSRARWKQISR
jgi:hypothetical protein